MASRLDVDVTAELSATLSAHMKSNAFSGFGDGPFSFFAVYGELFINLGKVESAACGPDQPLDVAPEFGSASSSWEDTKEFYDHWESFSSSMSFANADLHDLQFCENRSCRRACEKENLSKRKHAKKRFDATVREKKDPRVKAHREHREELRQREEEVRRVADQERRRSSEERSAPGALDEDDGAALDEILQNIQRDEEIDARQSKKKTPKCSNANSSATSDFHSAVCKKTFGTWGQAEAHKKSKKHKKNDRARRHAEAKAKSQKSQEKAVEKLAADVERRLASMDISSPDPVFQVDEAVVDQTPQSIQCDEVVDGCQ